MKAIIKLENPDFNGAFLVMDVTIISTSDTRKLIGQIKVNSAQTNAQIISAAKIQIIEMLTAGNIAATASDILVFGAPS